ncbi:MAG: sialidase family protein [Planctomycetia bacterium]|nr:sialidase family protein [Planctomycetia bacterium]
MKRFLWVLLVLGFAGVMGYAQQTADKKKWAEEYQKRIDATIASRKAQKQNDPNDLYYSRPDFVVYRPAVKPEVIGDCYNDHFQVFDGPNGAMFALTCQATCEGALDQHVSLFKSTDKGKTWTGPKVLAGPKTMHEDVPIASWGFPMVSRSGRIYVIFNQYVEGKVSTHRQHTGLMTGIYSDDGGETFSKPQQIPIPRTSNDSSDSSIPPEWVVWQKPLRLAEGGKYLVGVTRYAAPEHHHKYRTVTEFIRFNNIDDNPEPKDISLSWMMTNEKVLHTGVHCEEPAIVKLPDGRLFALMRTSLGSPYWSVSSDGGENWTAPEKLLNKDGGQPFLHPVSPCPMYDWKGNEAGSGYYFALIHNQYDFNNRNPWQQRGPLYLIAGKYQPGAHQPVWFTAEPKLFIDRPNGNSFYTSTTQVDGKTVLWYPDQKFYLLGRVIGDEWFKDVK